MITSERCIPIGFLTIGKWGEALAVERFFADAEERLEHVEEERRQRLTERLALARAMMGSVDPWISSKTGRRLTKDTAQNTMSLRSLRRMEPQKNNEMKSTGEISIAAPLADFGSSRHVKGGSRLAAGASA